MHTVVQGDTLNTIAQQYSVDLSALEVRAAAPHVLAYQSERWSQRWSLQAVNPQIPNPNLLNLGQEVNIPPCNVQPGTGTARAAVLASSRPAG